MTRLSTSRQYQYTMNTSTTFPLTVRREDLLGIYGEKIEFKLFSREYIGRVIIIIVSLLLGGVALGGSFYEQKYVFYVILFAGGIAYCIYDLSLAYSTKKKRRASVEEWITEIEKFKTNIVSVTEEAVVYTRDQEVYTYPYATINVQEFEKHVQILTIDTFDSILLPKKAFAENEYEHFIQLVNKRINTLNDAKNLV